MDLKKEHQTATAAAYRAGAVLKKHFRHLAGIEKKGEIDLVTEADRESEEEIIRFILERYPEHKLLAEESGFKNASSDYCWVIDPLDGTTNFAHGLPIFCVSIALVKGDKILVGVVLNPVSGELFTAVSGHGAFLNGKRIHVSKVLKLKESLLVTGFPYNAASIKEEIIPRFENFMVEAQGIRRLGSAAIDLCYVADGRFDGFWEQNLNPWDTAAGTLILEEAGGRLTDFSGNSYDIYKQEILATNGRIHDQMLEVLKRDKR